MTVSPPAKFRGRLRSPQSTDCGQFDDNDERMWSNPIMRVLGEAKDAPPKPKSSKSSEQKKKGAVRAKRRHDIV